MIKSEEGSIILHDLLPYREDTLERVQKDKGVELYRLINENISCEPVSADVVRNWGTKKEVDVLILDGQATLLSRGYDNASGQIIFQPIPRSTLDVVKSEMQIKKDHLRPDKKHVLEHILPYVGIIMAAATIIASAFFIGEAFKENTTVMAEQMDQNLDHMERMVEIIRGGLDEYEGQQENQGNTQETPPLIE